MAEALTADPVFQPEPKEPAESMLTTTRPGVTRYKRNVVIGIIAAAAMLFVIGFVWAFAIPSSSATEEKEDDTAIRLNTPDLAALPKSYSEPAERPDLTGPPGTADMPAPGTDPNAPNTQLANGQPANAAAGQNGARSYPQPRQQSAAEQRAEAARDLAIRQEMAARSGGIMFDQAGGSSSTEDARSGQNASGAGAQQTAQQDNASGGSTDEPGRQNLQGRKEQFVQNARAQDYLDNSLQRPVSRYELKAGSIIPAALVTALNSDLPGQVIATVTENVYDHRTGRYILIPQGTRLFGKYDSRVAYAQSRALVVWNRIIYPNGFSINIGGMIGSDATGAAGLRDRVNNHYGSLFKGVLLSTAIAVGGAAADNAGTQNNQLVTAGGGAVSQEAARTGQEFVRRALDRQPTITIRPGYRLKIIVDRDMVLAPY